MPPHVSDTTLSARACYAAGVRETLECWRYDDPFRGEHLIMQVGKPVGVGMHAYSEGGPISWMRGRGATSCSRAW